MTEHFLQAWVGLKQAASGKASASVVALVTEEEQVAFNEVSHVFGPARFLELITAIDREASTLGICRM